MKQILYYKYITPDNVCQICGETETIIHSLFYYKHAIEVWEYNEYVDDIPDAPNDSFLELVLWMANKRLV